MPAPRLIEFYRRQRHLGTGQRLGLGADRREPGGTRPKPEPEDPQVELSIVGIQTVFVALAVDRWTRRPTPLQRPERATGLVDASRLEASCDRLEGQRCPALQERDDEQ